MSYDSSADTIFNPAGDPLPLVSSFFIEPELERGHSAPFGNSDGHFEGAAAQQETSVEGDCEFDNATKLSTPQSNLTLLL